MSKLARSFRKKYRYLTGAKTVKLNGVTLISDKARVPEYLRNLMFREVYEDTERNILLKILRPGNRVVEIGTGLGFISLLAAKICGADNVDTYEANPNVETLIRENFTLNHSKPRLHMLAVTRDGRRLSFNAADNIISSSAIDRDVSSTKIEISSVAISAVIEAHRPDVLIMDVEGAEYELLTIGDFGSIKHILVELHPHIIGEEKIKAIKDHLMDAGFLLGDSDRKATHFYFSGLKLASGI